jgi:hypothetical protein
MTIPAAIVVHTLPGRTRLRIQTHRHDREFFDRAVAVLAEMDGVGPVSGDARTGSLLIVHSGSIEALSEFARTRGLFDVVAAPPPGPPKRLNEAAGDTLRLADFAVRFKSRGRADLASLTFGALLAGAVVQTFRKQFLPASVTLLAYAARLIPNGSRR